MVLGGWNLSGLLRYESGRPLNITMNNDLGGLLFNIRSGPIAPRGPTRLQNQATSIRSPTTISIVTRCRIPGRCSSGTRRSATPTCAVSPPTVRTSTSSGVPGRRGEEPALRGAVRQYLQPRRLLRSEPELELAGVRPGQHTVQHAAGREFWIPIRLLTDNRTIRTPPLQKDPEGLSRGGAILG